MATRQITAILEKIKDQEQASTDLWQRMDRDHSDYLIESFMPNPEEGIEQTDVYTTNDPRTMADKAVAAIVSSEILLRIRDDSERDDDRDVNNNTERLALGMLREADKNIQQSGENAGLIDLLAWFSVVRGGHINARALLTKDAAGNTEVNIEPFDPRHAVAVSDKYGMVWAAFVSRRSRGTIKAQYPKFRFSDNDASDSDQFTVYDYYERRIAEKEKTDDGGELLGPKFEYYNGVIIDERWAKSLHNTFAVLPPIVLRANGANPIVSNYAFRDTNGVSRQIDGIKGWSESLLAANRGAHDAKSRLLTYGLTLTARVIQGIYTLTSKGGESELQDSPNERGQAIPLDSEKDEELKLLEIAQTTADSQIFLQAITQEAIRGGLLDPSEIAGANPSGRALRIMGQILREKLGPHIKAVEGVINGSIDALIAQFETERYKPLLAVGETHALDSFNREISPEDIKGHGPITVTLTPSLPEDDLEKWQINALASTPDASGFPQASRRTRWTRILGFQDAELEERRIHAEMVPQTRPVLLLWEQVEAAAERGDTVQVAKLMQEIQRMEEQEFMQDFARKMAFMGMLSESGIQAAANGVDPASSNGTGTQRNPTSEMAPESAPLSGTVLGGENIGAGRPPLSPGAQAIFERTGLVVPGV